MQSPTSTDQPAETDEIPARTRVPRRVRVIKNDRRATVRYTGPVDDSVGTWHGVEWDDMLGKHDGRGYFKCRRGNGTGGSFIRSSAVREAESLVSVMNESYTSQPQGGGEMKWANTQIKVDLVGFSKISAKQSLDRLQHVSLVDSYAGILPEPISVLTETLPMITVLDLSGSLFGSWSDLAKLCHSLPTLHSLHLNRMRLEVDVSEHFVDSSFNNIRLLTLFETFHTPQEISYLSQYWPSLEELHLGHNELTECPALKCPLLQLINLQNNRIRDLQSLCSLQDMNHLAHVNIQNNAIESLATCPVLSQVSKLWIHDNLIKKWSCIDTLAKWSNMTELRCARNPVYTDMNDRGVARIITIARIPQLQLINRSEITVDSRNGAERYYLKLCADAILNKTGSPISSNLSARQLRDQIPAEILAEYPTLIALAEKHGGLPMVAPQQKDSISVICVTAVKKNGEQHEVRVQPNLSIAKLKSIVARALKVSPRSMAMSIAMGTRVEPLADDTQTLSYYNIQEGSVIQIQ